MAQPMVGEIRMLAGNKPPPGWACCDGQLLPIHEYKDLYAVIGTRYGGDGRTTFALPDLRDRTPVHSDGGSYRVGQQGGESGHVLTPAELPGHAHGNLELLRVAESAPSGASTGSVMVEPADPATGTKPHDNLQPYLSVTFVIALHGASPARK